MKRSFIAVPAWLSELTYPQRFVLISLVFALPLAAVVGLFYLEQAERIDRYGQRELYGTVYLRPLHQLLADVHAHQWAVADYVEHGATLDDALAVQARIEADLQALERLDQQYGPFLQTESGLAGLRGLWQALEADVQKLPASEGSRRHAALLAEIRALMVLVGDTSFLSLDPDLDTSAMVDAVLLKLPEAQSLIAEAVLLGESAAARESLTAEEQARLLVLIGLLRSNQESMEQSVRAAFSRDSTGQLQPLVEPGLAASLAATRGLVELIETRLIWAEAITVEPDSLAAAGAGAFDATASLYAAASEGLEIGLRARIARQLRKQISVVAFAAVFAGAAFFIGLSAMRAISRPLTELAEAARRLGEGELSARVDAGGTDEISRVGRSFNQMAGTLQLSQQRLEERTRALAASAAISRQLSTLLDQQDVVLEVVEMVRAAFNYYHVHIYLFDETGEHLDMVGGTGEAGRLLLEAGHRIPKGRGLVGRAAEHNAVVLAPDTSQDPSWLPNALLPGTRSELAVPIASGAQVLGVLDVQHDSAGALTQADAELIQAVAHQVAVALQNARLYQQTRQKAEYEALANQIGRKIRGATTAEGVLQVAALELGQALGASRASAQLGLARPKSADRL